MCYVASGISSGIPRLEGLGAMPSYPQSKCQRAKPWLLEPPLELRRPWEAASCHRGANRDQENMDDRVQFVTTVSLPSTVPGCKRRWEGMGMPLLVKERKEGVGQEGGGSDHKCRGKQCMTNLLRVNLSSSRRGTCATARETPCVCSVSVRSWLRRCQRRTSPSP